MAKAVHGMSHLHKRSRLADDPGPRLKKRRRVQHGAPAAPAIYTHEELQWRDVAIPDRLEDAEGFLGLGIEEIEDVEVVKDKDNSAVKFRVRLSSMHLRHEHT